MRLQYRLALPPDDDLMQLIKTAGLSYTPGGYNVVFLSEKQVQKFPQLRQRVANFDITKIYTKDELLAAEFLIVRPSWQQFGITNAETAIEYPCIDCFANARQVEEYVMNVDVKRLKRPFLRLNGTNDILVTQDTRELLKQSGLSGFSFRNVMCRKKDRVSQIFSQLVIENILPPAMLNNSSEHELWDTCKTCGTEILIPNSEVPIRMSKIVLDDAGYDICKSFEQFGEIVRSRSFIISGRFYKFLVSNKMEHGLAIDDIITLE